MISKLSSIQIHNQFGGAEFPSGKRETYEIKKLVCLLLAVVMAAAMLPGCGAQTSGSEKTENKKEKVTVALWGTQLLENYAQ